MISSQELDPPIAVMAIDFVSHLRRASELLDGLSAANPDNGSPENMVARFDTAASFTVGRDLSIGALNPAAAAALGLVPGAHLSALPLEPEDQKAWPNTSPVCSIRFATRPCPPSVREVVRCSIFL